MNLLIIGGTIFLGRHLVEAALARGHRVTLFHRGRHGPELYPEVERLHGDRDPQQDGGQGLALLRGRRWDAAIDTCGYVPRVVRAAAEALAGCVEHYTFVSSISVYAHFRQAGLDESAPLGELAGPATEEVDGASYGPLKALSEQAAQQAFGARALVIRPGLIVGPHDPSDRFTYWVARLAAGGEVLAPAPPSWPVQFIDVRDLAGWMLDLAERRQAGVYHATGPDAPTSMAQLLEACHAAAGADARLAWVDQAFLAEQQVGPWIELPLWIPGDDPDAVGFNAVDCSRARAAGLAFREVAATVRDTLAWHRTRPADHQWRAGLTREREQALLAAWHARG